MILSISTLPTELKQALMSTHLSLMSLTLKEQALRDHTFMILQILSIRSGRPNNYLKIKRKEHIKNHLTLTSNKNTSNMLKTKRDTSSHPPHLLAIQVKDKTYFHIDRPKMIEKKAVR